MKIIDTVARGIKWLTDPGIRRAKARHAYERALRAQGHSRKNAAHLAWLKYGSGRDES